MGSLYLAEMADWFRAAGLEVIEQDGWQNRSRSSGGFEPGRPWGVWWHHTASQTSAQNDADYCSYGADDRPICNILVPRDGTVWCLAAGASNTNGKGGPTQVSRGTIPLDSANTHVVGMEICNNGYGEPYPQIQIDTAFTVSTTLCERLGLLPSDVCTHQAYAPTRKVDPATATAVQGPWQPGSCTSSGTWDLDDLKAECNRRALGGQQEEDMPLSDEDINKIADAVWAHMIDTTGKDGYDDQEAARFLLDRTYNTVQRIEEQLR